MQPFVKHTGLVAPMDRENVDTDAIIPKQYLKSIKRTGFGPNLFDDWRYLDPGGLDIDNDSRRLNPDFVLNQERYQGASILLARDNFGCGSSREHAVWALADAGFRAVIAPSYADIFYSNCFKNGVLPVVLPRDVVDTLFREVYANPGYELTVDLQRCAVTRPGGESHGFEVDAFRRDCLLQGLDDIGLTLARSEKIRAYEERRRRQAPWLFDAGAQA